IFIQFTTNRFIDDRANSSVNNLSLHDALPIFLIKEVAKDIYTFPVTLPNNPLKALNVYVVKGKDRTVVFDTGFNAEASREDLLKDRKSTRLNSSHVSISYAVFCLNKKNKTIKN